MGLGNIAREEMYIHIYTYTSAFVAQGESKGQLYPFSTRTSEEATNATA